MKNELFTIGPLTVYGYGFMIAVGVLAAWLTAEYRAKKYRADTDQIFFLVAWCLLGGLLGAKILFWITEWKEIAEDPGFILRTMTDGFVVYGGIIGGIIAGWLYSRITKLNFLKYFDLLIPLWLWLRDLEGSAAFWQAAVTEKRLPDGRPLLFMILILPLTEWLWFPTQIYSSVLDFVHFGILLWIARNKKADGQVAACYMIFYSAGRFVLEFFRGDLIRGSVGVLSTSQFISLFVMAAGLVMLGMTTVRAGRK